MNAVKILCENEPKAICSAVLAALVVLAACGRLARPAHTSATMRRPGYARPIGEEMADAAHSLQRAADNNNLPRSLRLGVLMAVLVMLAQGGCSNDLQQHIWHPLRRHAWRRWRPGGSSGRRSWTGMARNGGATAPGSGRRCRRRS